MWRYIDVERSEQLWSESDREPQLITGFDRVMVYHFHPDDHGDVVAEVAAAGKDPCLGLY